MPSKVATPSAPAPGAVRLNRFLAAHGVASRRACDAMILAGRVTLDGETTREPWISVVPGAVEIAVDGHVLESAAPVYLMLNKPPGVVTTAQDPMGRRTVVDLIELPHRVFPIGRLDFDTEGLLLLTNDGELAYRLMHPSFKVPKTYHARVAGIPSRHQLEALARGPMLEDGPTQPAEVMLVKTVGKEAILEITITEGKKRQVRRMCKAVGHPVLGLQRVKYGEISLGRLTIGRWRRLNPSEVDSLRRAVGLADAPRHGRSVLDLQSGNPPRLTEAPARPPAPAAKAAGRVLKSARPAAPRARASTPPTRGAATRPRAAAGEPDVAARPAARRPRAAAPSARPASPAARPASRTGTSAARPASRAGAVADAPAAKRRPSAPRKTSR